MDQGDGRSAHIIILTLQFPEPLGSGEVRTENSVFLRPLQVLATQGRPIGKLTYLVTSAAGFPTFTVGSLVHSEGDRIIFFPGLAARHLLWYTEGEAPDGGVVHHITLDRDRETFHIALEDELGGTSPTSRPRLPRHPTRLLPGGARLWFGLSLRDATVLEVTPSELRFVFSAPPLDSARRVKDMVRAREGSDFHLLSLFDGEPLEAGMFLHFDFAVSPLDREELEPFQSFAPTGPPLLREAVDTGDQWKLRQYKVELETLSEAIWVVISSWQGRLVEEVILSFPLGT